jgi:hypothetical protein
LKLARKGQEGHRAITTKAKKSYMDELLVSNKHLLKAGVAFNPSNSFQSFIHSFIHKLKEPEEFF